MGKVDHVNDGLHQVPPRTMICFAMRGTFLEEGEMRFLEASVLEFAWATHKFGLSSSFPTE